MKKPAKILVIDDDIVIREIVSSFLSGLSHNVYTAADSTAAEKIIKEKITDLIISDVRMPDKDGIEILKYAKSVNSNIPVILITAYDDVEMTIKAMQLGAYDYIEKPLDKNKFLFVVERALETKRLSERLEVISSEADEQDKPEEQLIGKSEPIRKIEYKD